MFSDKIIKWYLNNKRELPWRQTSEPYYIWLSEIIMQQTRVDQGLPYYLNFVEKFPTVFDLAAATESEVLRTWQGLGYYSRGRNLHLTAKYVCDELKGVFPKNYKELLKLKGVGPYTAAAIASISYGEPKAVVDGNVYRVLSRLYEIETPINSSNGIKEFATIAQELISEKKPGDYNQGIMEIGATICTPKKPKCDICPIIEHCKAFENKHQLSFPVKLKKTKTRHRFFNYLVIKSGDSYYVEKRTEKDIWIGLNEFLLIESKEECKTIDDFWSMIPSWLSIYNIVGSPIRKIQILSHQIINATFWPIEITNNPNIPIEKFLKIEQIEELPKHRLIEKYLFENI
jgi:A/G-specific adenine glycosylase